MVELKIKLDKEATMPFKANLTDSGYDLVATSVTYNEENSYLQYGTGVYLHIPEGYEVNLLPRSSISKYDLVMPNSPGKVDEDYRKELFIRMKVPYKYDMAKFEQGRLTCYTDNEELEFAQLPSFVPIIYKVGDKIAQMEMRKKLDYSLIQVENVEDTYREGFGSTDYQQHYKSGSILSEYGDIPDGGLVDKADDLVWKTNG